MTTDITLLLAAATPLPWTADTSAWGCTFACTLRADAAPATIDITDPVAARTLHKAVAHFRLAEDGEAILTLVNALAALLSGEIDGATHQAVTDALTKLGAVAARVGEQVVPTDMAVLTPTFAVTDGSRLLHITTMTNKGRRTSRLIGCTARGDGSDSLADARLIAALPTIIPELLAQTTETVHYTTTIDGRSVLADAADGPKIERGRWKIRKNDTSNRVDGWTIRPETIVDAKTGKPLADILMGCDGLNNEAWVGPSDDRAIDFDLRKHRLGVKDRRERFPLDLAPEVIRAIERGKIDVTALVTKAVLP